MKKAIIYSAHGENYIKKAFEYAGRTRKIITDNTALILHTSSGSYFNAPNHSPFDIFVNQEASELYKQLRYGFKIECMKYACEFLEFDRFLFLDTDACLIKSEALEVFELLDQYDMAVAHAPIRHAWKNGHDPKIDGLNVPFCYPEFNTGVILFKKTCVSIFNKWLELYLDNFKKHKHDQGAFRTAAYFSGLKIATLTPEYNDRGFQPSYDEKFIIHTRNMNYINTKTQ